MSSSDLHNLLASGQAPLLLRPPTHGSNTGRINAFGDMNNENSGGNDTKSSSVTTFQGLIKKWEEQKNNNSYDPTDCLNEMADILERVSENQYFKNSDQGDIKRYCLLRNCQGSKSPQRIRSLG